jgi:hypothetical protein
MPDVVRPLVLEDRLTRLARKWRSQAMDPQNQNHLERREMLSRHADELLALLGEGS